MEFPLVALATLSVLAAAVCLWHTYRAGSTHELASKTSQLALDVAELYDRLERRDKREAQRRSTEAKLERKSQIEVDDVPRGVTKADLRRTIFRKPAARSEE